MLGCDVLMVEGVIGKGGFGYNLCLGGLLGDGGFMIRDWRLVVGLGFVVYGR